MQNENSAANEDRATMGEISTVDASTTEVVETGDTSETAEETAAALAELAELESDDSNIIEAYPVTEEYLAEVDAMGEASHEAEDAMSFSEILDERDAIDVDFMLEFLTAHELDPARRDKLFQYVEALGPVDLRALWEAFQGTFGRGITQIDLTNVLDKQVKNVDNSVSLKLRNEAVENELKRFGNLYAQLSRTFNSDMTDTPLNAFRVDNITGYIKSLHHQLTTVNSAVLEMAEIIMVEETSGDVADMAINIDRIKRICALVGYGAKNWGRIHETAKAQALAHKKAIEELTEKLRVANEASATNAALYAAERTAREKLALGSSLFIGNHSGNYITTINDPENEYFRVSPFNLTITQDKDEALQFDDIEDARKVLDAVRVWGKRNLSVRRKFKEANLNPETLFISAVTTVKVEG